MTHFKSDMQLFRQELEKGNIQRAYQELIAFFRTLKSHFEESFPEYDAQGGIYYGYLTMTFFSLFPKFLKEKKLKVLVVFIYNTFTFEVWLSGRNRDVQAATWGQFKKADWDAYPLSINPRKEDFIARSIITADPDFGDLETLTDQIEAGTITFIQDVEKFLSQYPVKK